jgi:MFS family permease
LKEIGVKDTSRKTDWPGFATFTTGLTAFLLSITLFSYGISEENLGIALTILGLALIGAFVRIETRTENPLIDLRLFKIREFMGGNLAQLLNALAWSGVIIMVSFYLQIALHQSALQAGLALLPLEATYSIVAPLSGSLSDRYGPRWFSTIGLLISSAGFFLLSAVSVSTSYYEISICLALLGAGNGMFVSPNLASIMGSVPPNRRGIASGFRVTVFNVGLTASSGLAILLITTGLPYSVFSALISGVYSAGMDDVIPQFITGFKTAAFVLAVINTSAIIPSFLRGPRHNFGIDN